MTKCHWVMNWDENKLVQHKNIVSLGSIELNFPVYFVYQEAGHFCQELRCSDFKDEAG